MLAPDQRRLRRSVPVLVFELLVVFIGVYGAFLVDRTSDARQRREREVQIYAALDRELGDFAQYMPQVATEIGRRVEAWRAADARGERNAPVYYREPHGERAPTGVWDATLASGGVTLLEPALFFRLANYYNRVVSINDRYARYNAFTEREVLPRLVEGPASFYAPDSGPLRPEFRVHMDRLAEFREELLFSARQAAELQGQVRARMRSMGMEPADSVK